MKTRAFLHILMISAATVVSAQTAEALTCHDVFKTSTITPKALSKTDQQKQVRERYRDLTRKDAGEEIERRPKMMTSGDRRDADSTMDLGDVRIDSADPSLVMPIRYPNGETRYRINFSGMRFIEVKDPREFYKGGVFKVLRSRGFYADGTEMVGPYHNASWPWDVVIYKNDAGEQIAYGGVMRQPEPGKLPHVANDNATRSRWWGLVKHVEVSRGVFEEHIVWQGPVHDFNALDGGHSGWNLHGYGGTLVTRFDPKTGLHRETTTGGNPVMFYERVTQEKVGDDGIARPWVTTLFARKVDPSLKFAVGPEISVLDIQNQKTGRPYEATRRGQGAHPEGYLAEGGNVLIERTRNQAVSAFSGNDYVAKYGIYLAFRKPGQSAFGKFQPVLDSKGELVDFAAKLRLRELLNLTWVGRPQMEYDPTGKLWLRFHGVPIHVLPKGEPVEGWPSAEGFVKIGRQTFQIPVKLVVDEKGQPSLEWDIDAKFASLYL